MLWRALEGEGIRTSCKPDKAEKKNPENHRASLVFRAFRGILSANFWSGQRSYYCPGQHADLWIPGNVHST